MRQKEAAKIFWNEFVVPIMNMIEYEKTKSKREKTKNKEEKTKNKKEKTKIKKKKQKIKKKKQKIKKDTDINCNENSKRN